MSRGYPSLHRTYLGTRDNHLDLSTRGAHDLGELVADALQDAQSVVLGQRSQEVLDGLVGARGAQRLLQLGYDGALVAGGQGGGAEDGHQLLVLGDEVTEGAQGLGSRVEG